MSTVPTGTAGTPAVPPPIEIKSGWSTSELGMALAAMIPPVVALLAVLWKWTPAQAEAWQGNLSAVIALVGSLAFTLAPVWKFIQSRTAVKAAAVQAFTRIHYATADTFLKSGIEPPRWRLRV